MHVNELAKHLGDACYVFLAINFFWGLYCVIMGWMRVGNFSFRKREDQTEFLEELTRRLRAGQHDAALEMCTDDIRALPQLAGVAIKSLPLGFESMRQAVMEVLQRDVIGDLEYRTGWVATVVKSGPLLGLFGTVLGMMAAFGRIGSGEKVNAIQIADEISIALICTAMGLMTAIPFNFLLASINVRIRRLQDSMTAGLVRVLEVLKTQAA